MNPANSGPTTTEMPEAVKKMPRIAPRFFYAEQLDQHRRHQRDAEAVAKSERDREADQPDIGRRNDPNKIAYRHQEDRGLQQPRRADPVCEHAEAEAARRSTPPNSGNSAAPAT